MCFGVNGDRWRETLRVFATVFKLEMYFARLTYF